MNSIFTLILLIAASCAAVASDRLCPVCNQIVVPKSTQKDDLSKPSKNLAVWSRSHSGDVEDGIFICIKDSYAFDTTSMKWSLLLSDRDGFAYPLTKAIHSFPLPANTKVPNNALYSQRFESLKSVTHDLQFWCLTDPDYFKTIEAYAKKNGLSLTMGNMERNGRYKGESIVRVEKKTEQGGAGQPTTRPESKSEGSHKTHPEAEGRSR